MRLLRNKRSGVIQPWNQYLATHPDMVDYEEPPKPVKRRNAKKKAASTPAPAPDTEIDDLLANLD